LPVLTIIAGPNGAGKSTHSKELLSESGIEAFDFDKEFYAIWGQFSFDPAIEQGAYNRAQERYLERRTEALDQDKSFAFETNYHTDDLLRVIDLFKSKGYRTELIFICLETPELAIERVKQRVLKGGHFVDEATIKTRFDSGLRLLDKTFQKFDLVTIYRSEQNLVQLAYVLEPEKNAFTVLSGIPSSLRPFLNHLLDFPTFN